MYDALGRSGRFPFSVLSSEVLHINIVTPTNALIRSETAPVAVSLEDLYGNAGQAEFHTLTLRVTNGFILLPDGEKVSEKTYSTIDGYIIAEVGSENEGSMTLEASVDEGLIREQKSIRIIPRASISLEQSSLPVA